MKLRVEDLCCRPQSDASATPLFSDVSFNVDSGERVGLVGPSGSGKTLLLRVLVNQYQRWGSRGGKLTACGHVWVDGKRTGPNSTWRKGARARRRTRGKLLLASHGGKLALSPHRKAESLWYEALRLNPARDRRLRWLPAPPCARQAVDEIVERLGLCGCRGKRLDELSGGEAQRTILARVLVYAPEILLIDEPTTGLDKGLRIAISALLSEYFGHGAGEWRHRLGINDDVQPSLLIASHHLGVLDSVVDRFVVLEDPTATCCTEVAMAESLDPVWLKCGMS